MGADLAPAVRDLAGALGLLDEHDSLSGEFFEHPLECVRRALAVEQRRTRLVAGIDALLERDAALSVAGPPELRAYPLVDLDEGRLDLGLQLDGSAVTLTLLGRVVVDEGVAVEVEVPLVHAHDDDVDAVTGTLDGPVTVRAVVLIGGGDLAMQARVHDQGGSFGLRLTGLELNGSPVPPLEIDSSAFTGGVEHTLRVVLDLATSVLGTLAGGPAGDVIRHLPGVLGLADDLPPLPLGDLADVPGTFRTWLAQLAAGPGLREWLDHLAGLAGLSVTGTGPWSVRIVDGPPTVDVEVVVVPGTPDRLEVLLRLAVDAPGVVDATASAAVTIVRLPLAGSEPEAWFPGLSAQVALPSAGTTTPLVPVTGGFGVGRAEAGLVVVGDQVRPHLLLTGVTLAGRAYPRLDLSDADALTSAGGQVAADAIDELLGTDGLAGDLLVLVGLRAGRPGDPVIDLARLATDPLRALGEHHLALLRGPGWGGPLSALAHLFGVAAPVVDGNRVLLVEDGGARLWLVAAADDDGAGGTVLDVGLEVSLNGRLGTADSPMLRGSARLLRFSFAASGAVQTSGLDGLRLVVSTGPLGGPDDPVSADGLSASLGWDAGSPGRVSVQIGDLTLSLPDGSPVSVGDLRLPFDAQTVPSLARAALAALAARAPQPWDTMAGLLADTLVDLADDVDLADPDALADLPAALWARLTSDDDALLRLASAVLGPVVTLVRDGWESSEDDGLVLGGSGGGSAAWPDDLADGSTRAWPDDPEEAAGRLAALLRVAAARDEACAAALAGLDPLGIAADLVALAAGDPLWPSAPTTGWPVLTSPALATEPFAGIAEPLLDQLLGWSGTDGVLVAVAPAWWPGTGWLPLLDELDARDASTARGRTWAGVDLRRDPTAALAQVAAADAYLVSGDDQVGALLGRVAALTGRPLTLVAVGTSFAPVAQWVAAQGGTGVAGLVAVTAPLGDDAGQPPAWSVASAAPAVRVAATVLRAGSPGSWARLAGAWREAADGCAEPTTDRPATSGVLTAVLAAGAAAAAASAAAALPAAIPRVAVVVDPSSADDPDEGGTPFGLLEALRAAVAGLPGAASTGDDPDAGADTGGNIGGGNAGGGTGTGLRGFGELLGDGRLGVAGGPGLPAATGRVAGSARAELWLAPGPALQVRVRVVVGGDGPLAAGGGWLAGPPSGSVPVAVRRLEVLVGARLDLAGGATPTATVQVTTQDVRVAGALVPVCRPGDPGFEAALTAALDALAGATDAHATALHALLAGLHLADGGLDQLLADPVGALTELAVEALDDGGLLGLTLVPGLPPGTEQWVRRFTLDPLGTGEAAGQDAVGEGTGGTGGAGTGADTAPGLEVRLGHTGGQWSLAAGTGDDGWDLPGGGRLTARVESGPAGCTVAASLTYAGVSLVVADGHLSLALAGRPAVRLWPTTDADLQALGAELAAHLPATLGAGVASALLATLGVDADVAGLLALLRDPVGELRQRSTRPGLLADLLTALGEWLGLPSTADGAIVLVPGVVELGAQPQDDGVLLRAGTPAAGWAPAAGLHLLLGAGVLLRAPAGADAGQALPHGEVGLTIDLPGAAAAAWTSLGLDLSLAEKPDGSVGVRLRLLPTPGDPVELVPTFGGVGQLVGAGAQRMLPTVLDALRDTLPVEVRDPLVTLSVALGVHGDGPGEGFDDGPVPLRDLTAQTIVDRAAPLATALVDLLDGWFGGLAGLDVTAIPGGVRLSADGPAGSTIGVDLLTTPGLGVSLAELTLGPVALGIEARGELVAGMVALSGAAQVDVDLLEPLRIAPGPRLRAELATDGTVSVVLRPLGDAVPADDLSVTFAPVPAVALTAAGGVELATRWVVAPGLELLVVLLDDELDVSLGTPQPGHDAPTLRSLLTGAGLLAGGHVVAPLPPPVQVLTGAVASIASTLSIEVAPGVDLRLLADGDVVGISLSGTVDLGGEEWRPALLLGADGADGLVLEVLRHGAAGTGLGSTGWDLAPAITLDDVGFGLSRTGGLVQTQWITLDGVGAWLGTSFRLDPNTGAVSVDPISAALQLAGIGLPALSGGGGNPVAGSLLGDANGGGAPVNPPMDLVVAWTGTRLEIRLEGAGPDGTLWVEVGRTFGPLYIGRVGIKAGMTTLHVDGQDVEVAIVGVLVDGSVTIGPLGMAVRGLGLSIPPQYAHRPELWRLELDGLAVDFRSSSLSISGGLLKAPALDEHGRPIVVNGEVAVDYRGMLQVQAFGFGATALGAYSQVPRPDGSSYASLFVFVAINAPLGGPPYLFITGVAAGFGINRGFLPPSSIDQVGSFPLIAAMGSLSVPPEQVLDQMGPSLPVRDGAYWFAAGITFSTFEIIHTRALAYLVITPQGFEVGLLGLMAAALPDPESPLVTLELGLRASYSSIDNLLQVQAQLTANSWLFSKDCRLTGGFAFMIWFSRPQAVLTMGGYGPRYPVPAHFPSVPPLGFEWRFSEDIVIKGESYFAVTPEAIMAGGRLEVSAKGGWGYGSLVLYADVLLWFHPPKFELWAGIRITGKAFGFGFELSAEVYLRVPPVYGKVTVHFLWGFEFEFGQLAPPAQFLDLPAFLERFVDATGTPYGLRVLLGALAADEEDAPDGSPDHPFLVGPEFGLEATSRLPARSVTCGGFAHTDPLPLFAVPMGPHPALDPHLSVALAGVGGASGTLSALAVSLARTPVASAVWAGAPGSGVVGPPDAGSLTADDMRQVPAGVRLDAVATVSTPAGAAPLALAQVVDDTDPWGLPLPDTAPVPAPPVPAAVPVPAPVARVGLLGPAIAPATPGGSLAEPAPVAAQAALARTVATGAGLRVWDLRHELPSGRLTAHGARVVAVNLVGDVLLDAVADGEVDLPDEAASVVVLTDDGLSRAGGWDLSTSLQLVTSSLLLAPGACVRLPAPFGSGEAGATMPAYRVVRPAERVGTRLAARAGDVVVVAADALRRSADPAGVRVQVVDGSLGPVRTVGDAATGRWHLVAAVRTAGPSFEVVVAVDDDWSQAGVALRPAPASRDGVAVAFEADPWAPLLAGGPEPVAEPASVPAVRHRPAVRFVAPEPVPPQVAHRVSTRVPTRAPSQVTEVVHG